MKKRRLKKSVKVIILILIILITFLFRKTIIKTFIRNKNVELKYNIENNNLNKIDELIFPNFNSNVVLVYDDTDDKLLYAQNETKQTYIASLTKVTTAIVAIEMIDNLDETITVNDYMLTSIDPEASVAGLMVGDEVSYLDLLYATLLPSGADACVCLAIALTGSVEDFVSKMNEFASNLQLEDTFYVNNTGLDETGHISSANDVLKVLKYSLNNKIFEDIFNSKYYILSNGLKVESTLLYYDNWYDVSNIIGSKTGFTDNAKYNLVSTSNIHNHNIITIMINADKYYNVEDTLTNIKFINENYTNLNIIDINQNILSLNTLVTNNQGYDIYLDNDINLFVSNDRLNRNIDVVYKGIDNLTYYNQKGDVIGEIQVFYDDELLHTEKIYLKEELKLNVFSLFIKLHYLLIIFVVICYITLRKPKRKHKF